MDRKTQDKSRAVPKIQNFPVEQVLEVWDPPFDRWLKLTDDLLREWPQSSLPIVRTRVAANRGSEIRSL